MKIYSHRPEVLKAWGGLLDMDGRRYELATIAGGAGAAEQLLHARAWRTARGDYASTAEATAICGDFRNAGLAADEVAVMAYAEKIARDATSVTQADIDELRRHGLSDDEIFDVAAAAAARCFFTKVPDALGYPGRSTRRSGRR